MALIVETGAGASTSEAFASVADADLYFANRNITAWTLLTTADKEAALRRATDHMQQAYRERWHGTRVTSTQALDWPRWNVPMRDAPGGYGPVPAYYSSTAVPAEVRNACITMALKAAAGDLAPDIERETISESVGPISVSYAAGSRQTVRYQAVDKMLSVFLRDGGSGSMVTLLRA